MWWYIVVFIVALVVSYSMMPKPENAKPAGLGDVTAPTAEVGREIPVLFAHPASAGHGLNLQDGSNILALFGLGWNLEEYLQIIERIGPMRQKQSGYDRSVFVHRILMRNSVDEVSLQRMITKRSVQDLLLDAMQRSNFND